MGGRWSAGIVYRVDVVGTCEEMGLLVVVLAWGVRGFGRGGVVGTPRKPTGGMCR
jgi:hypothetical protein